jgi:hypothetical protein
MQVLGSGPLSKPLLFGKMQGSCSFSVTSHMYTALLFFNFIYLLFAVLGFELGPLHQPFFVMGFF